MAWQTLDQQYGQQADKNDRSNYLKDIIAGLSIASNNRPDTLLGYGLGRWLTNYVNRGLERRQQEKNQEALDTAMQGLMGPAVVPGNVVEGPASNRSVANNARQIAAEMYPNAQESAANSLMPNTDWLGRAQAQEYFPMDGGNNGPSVAQEIASRMTGIPQQPTTNILNMTSEDYYQQAYNVARKAGSTEEQARKFAQQRAGQYQSQRVNALSNAFLNGGIDADGTITRQGVGVLAQLAQEIPAQVNVLGNMFQTPQGATKYAQDIARATLNSNLGLRNAKEMAGVNFDYSQRSADANMQRQMAILNYRAQMDEAMRQGQQEKAYKMAFDLAKSSGASDQDARIQALGYVLGGGGGRGGNGRGSSGKNNENGIGYETLAKRSKDLWERYYDEMEGGWKNQEAEKEYNRIQERIQNIIEGRPDSDSGNPQSVAMFALNVANQYGISVPQALEAIKRKYPDADIDTAAQLLNIQINNQSQPQPQPQPQSQNVEPSDNGKGGSVDDKSEDSWRWYNPDSEVVSSVLGNAEEIPDETAQTVEAGEEKARKKNDEWWEKFYTGNRNIGKRVRID